MSYFLLFLVISHPLTHSSDDLTLIMEYRFLRRGKRARERCLRAVTQPGHTPGSVCVCMCVGVKELSGCSVMFRPFPIAKLTVSSWLLWVMFIEAACLRLHAHTHTNITHSKYAKYTHILYVNTDSVLVISLIESAQVQQLSRNCFEFFRQSITRKNITFRVECQSLIGSLQTSFIQAWPHLEILWYISDGKNW